MSDEKNQKTQTDQTLEFEKGKTYSPQEAIQLAKKMKKANFDASVELHARLGINPKKGDQQVRGAVSLPHGTGKDVKIAAFVEDSKQEEVKQAGADYAGGEDLIDQIKKSEKTDFEVAVAQSSMMKSLSKVAKILGTRGLMPSPKNETITDDPAKTVQELKKGKISYKNDKTGNIHAIIGKVSFSEEALTENFNTLIQNLRKNKPIGSKGTYIRNVVLSTSMGPGIKVDLGK